MKTLNEIRIPENTWDSMWGRFIRIDRLKELAQEWIDEMDKGYCMDHEEYHLYEWSDPYECEIGNEMAKHVLRTFFNLED